MFASALIVFRETLEAALLIGIIAAATRNLPERTRWIVAGIVAGLLGSLGVASVTDRLGEMFGGVGQEVFNAVILGIAVAMLAWHSIWMSTHGREMATRARAMATDLNDGRRELSALAVVIALTVLREGSETVLFLYGAATGASSSLSEIIGGGALGLIGGVATGFGLYAGLLRIPLRWFFTATNALVLLLAAGMAGQMARNLIQGDIIPSLATPLWDTSSWLPADSAVGSLLRVIAGYDANPTGMQVIFYFATLVVIATGMALTKPRLQPRH
ncbi:MAG: FTR1 family iron permease [Betaproteobacteria bacterium]